MWSKWEFWPGFTSGLNSGHCIYTEEPVCTSMECFLWTEGLVSHWEYCPRGEEGRKHPFFPPPPQFPACDQSGFHQLPETCPQSSSRCRCRAVESWESVERARESLGSQKIKPECRSSEWVQQRREASEWREAETSCCESKTTLKLPTSCPCLNLVSSNSQQTCPRWRTCPQRTCQKKIKSFKIGYFWKQTKTSIHISIHFMTPACISHHKNRWLWTQ